MNQPSFQFAPDPWPPILKLSKSWDKPPKGKCLIICWLTELTRMTTKFFRCLTYVLLAAVGAPAPSLFRGQREGLPLNDFTPCAWLSGHAGGASLVPCASTGVSQPRVRSRGAQASQKDSGDTQLRRLGSWPAPASCCPLPCPTSIGSTRCCLSSAPCPAK